MAEKKENNKNNKNIKIGNFNNYFELIKKYFYKLFELDTELYFFIGPGIALLVGLLPISSIIIYFIGIYVCVSALILSYKFYKDRADNVYAAIFAGIAIIYNPLFFLGLNIDPMHIVLTFGLFVLGHKKFKEED